jgi:hypothetical protein
MAPEQGVKRMKAKALLIQSEGFFVKSRRRFIAGALLAVLVSTSAGAFVTPADRTEQRADLERRVNELEKELSTLRASTYCMAASHMLEIYKLKKEPAPRTFHLNMRRYCDKD